LVGFFGNASVICVVTRKNGATNKIAVKNANPDRGIYEVYFFLNA
jgi:hypothetical protein